MEFRILGPLEVLHEGRNVAMGGSRERALLALLLLSPNRVVSSERLAEDLWAGRQADGAVGAIKVYVSRLRRALREAGVEGSLVTRAPGYLVEIDPDAVDAFRFETLVAEAREQSAAGEHAGAAATLREALALWRGPALADVSDAPFARAEATRLEEERLGAVEARVEADLACGRHGDVIAELEALTGAHPVRERFWSQRMLALYRCGRQAEALAVYQELRHTLSEELGLDPSPELRQLETAVLRQEPELSSPSTPTATATPTGLSWPTGSADTVAFLFSDIEASTRRWEGDQEGMAADLARHDELLFKAVEAHGGQVFSHSGDGLCVAFSTVQAALETAVVAQRALAATTWSASAPLRVRMAVHAGAAQRRAGTWLGPTLNRTARLLATAAGGQVICSQAAADLVRDDLPAGLALVDLGEHRLADLARPEQVHGVTHPDLPSDFPPLRSLDVRRHNLPVALTSFVGREKELAEVTSLLDRSRLLTLTGAGGSGKTRLALQVAAASLEHFPDGAWLVELAPLRDPALVSAEVVRALGVLPAGLAATGGSLEEGLCNHLRTRHLLLVLDNCEHVLEAVAPLVHSILARCPDVALLATSREVLALPGEVTWTVPPLSLPASDPGAPEDLESSDAVALFCERARAVQPGFGLSAANASAVVAICRRLDGLPLGLELAAGRMRALGAHQVAERLDDRFRLLTGAGRVTLPRHQTLRAAMDWSYGLLSPAEQVVLRRLAVFPETFDLEAAEAVVGSVADATDPAGVGFEVLDLMSRLVDKSLVVVGSEEPGVRYRLLETVREYAGEKLSEADEADAARQRHRDFFLALVDHWARSRGGYYYNWGFWLHRSGDRDNFHAALEWSAEQGHDEELLRLAAALWNYWAWTGSLEGQRWLEQAVARCDVDSPIRVEALIGLATLLRWQPGGLERAEGLLEEALVVARRLQSPSLVAHCQLYLAYGRSSRGQRREAEHMWRDVLAAWKESNFVPGQGWAHIELGWVALAEGDHERAGAHFEETLALADQIDDDGIRVHARPALALVAALAGDHERASHLADEAVREAERLAEWSQVLVMALARATQVAILGEDDRQASRIVERLLRLLRHLGSRMWVAEGLEMAGLVLAGERPSEAAEVLAAAQALREALGEEGGQLNALSERLRSCRTDLIASLGPDVFAEHERRGRTMSPEAAVLHALATLDSLTAPAF